MVTKTWATVATDHFNIGRRFGRLIGSFNIYIWEPWRSQEASKGHQRSPKRQHGSPRRPSSEPRSGLHGICEGSGMSHSRLYGIYEAPGAHVTENTETPTYNAALEPIHGFPGSQGSHGNGVRRRGRDPPFHAQESQDDMSSQAKSLEQTTT